ncbi:MAG: tRNA uridine-5-carboxymethylaminomethyl(34) synthesis enzyme MnmG [Bacillota bacterium]|jgi:tRNA uridine 5-carboxymethylaminomethyl modification enzyme
MAFVAGSYDLVVVGAGHAGCEAALAAARLGAQVLVLTVDLDSVALLPCNPAIGGPAKGHIVREIAALGGEMARAIDDTLIQVRMLNTRKGPAVQTLRAQADKRAYQLRMLRALQHQPRLSLKQGMVEKILVSGNEVQGVETETGAIYRARAVVLTTGTYLRGRVIVGGLSYSSGPNGLRPANKLTESLRSLGLQLSRFKTGTPPRVSRRSVDFSVMEEQPGDPLDLGFSGRKLNVDNQLSCWLTYTNQETHRIFLDNLDRAPLYSGDIEGTGPRYCPSLEDKVVRFRDKERHQIFVEPEGWDNDEMYVQGFSTSMPEDVQLKALRTVRGLERAEIIRPGYAIEYDYLEPTQLELSLQCKAYPGLFSAGQINGSSGYEEAAGQGLLAGINAWRWMNGQEPIVLKRSESYIGVLIDDLVTKGTNEPYRMMTSRAEYRLLLRDDNADERLTPLGYSIGLVSEEQFRAYNRAAEERKRLQAFLKERVLQPGAQIDRLLKSIQSTPLVQATPLAQLLKRPGLRLQTLLPLVPELADFSSECCGRVETAIKYAGYLKKQQESVERFLRLEQKLIPGWVDYQQISGLSVEAREKLSKFRPSSLGQASRISGVSPADISVLMVFLEGARRGGREKC